MRSVSEIKAGGYASSFALFFIALIASAQCTIKRLRRDRQVTLVIIT